MKKLYNEYKKMIDQAIFVPNGQTFNGLGKTFEDVENVIRNDVVAWLKRVEVAKMALSYMEGVKAEKALQYTSDNEFNSHIEDIISNRIAESKVSNGR